MKISVIVCTYNRDRYIYNALSSIAGNDFPKSEYEIILVDNNCTDHTTSEVERFRKDFPEIDIKYVTESEQGLSHARNRGIRESNGDILVYVDDDATVNSSYLSSLSTLFVRRPDILAAGGPIIPVYEDGMEPKWMNRHLRRLLTGYLFFGKKEKDFPVNHYPGGGNAAYRRTVFEKTGLFNTDLGRKGKNLSAGEEKDIFDRMTSAGMKFIYTPDAVLYHIIPHYKLEPEYLRQVTFSIGKSERVRTLSVSRKKYLLRLLSEGVKWCGTFALCLFHLLRLNPGSGNRLLLFRYNVSRGLLSKTGVISHGYTL